MGLAPQRPEAFFQSVQRRARQAHHLLASGDQMHAFQAQHVHQHDLAVIVVAPGGRAAGQAGVRRLEDHRAPRGDDRVQHPPLFDKRSGLDHRGDRATAEAEALGEAARLAVGGQHMPGADDSLQGRNESGSVGHGVPPPLLFPAGDQAAAIVGPARAVPAGVPWSRMAASMPRMSRRPHSAMVVSSSVRRISSVRVTPALPPAPRP